MKQAIQRLALYLLRKTTDSGLIDFAKSEFQRAGWCDSNMKFECEMQGAVCRNVMDMLAVFSTEGHSGSSAPYTLNVFDRLAHWKPISPLTGSDDEWIQVGDDCYQNKHCSSVFKKGKDGKAYWLDAYVFRVPNGCTFTSYRSRQFIEFPWSEPDSQIVDVDVDDDGETIYPDWVKPIAL